MTKYNGKTVLTVGDGKVVPIHNIGDTVVQSNNNRPLLLKHVIHSPNISRNLISVSKLTAHNHLSV